MADVENLQDIEKVQRPDGWLGARHVQYGLLFSVNLLAYSIRNILNVAIIAMISDDPPDESVPSYPDWASKKNIMLSSFFWGYICLQIAAGQIAKNYGPKLFLTCAVFICSVFSILVPIFGAHFGYQGVIACRIVQGLSQGFIYPSVHNLLSAWVPLFNRAKVASFIYAGSPLGTVIAMPIAGYLSSTKWGWPSVFYLAGAVGILWSVIWMFIGADTPEKHGKLSEKEIRYIQYGTSVEDRENVSTPWKEIFTSLPFWAILISNAGNIWGYWTLLSELSTYMEEILGFDITSNSALSALPYFMMWLLSLIMGPFADYIVVRGITSLKNSRKIFNSIGLFIPAAALVCLIFLSSTQRTLTIIVFTVAIGFNSATLSGFNVNHIDIAPVHAGTLMGIANTASTLCAILAPLAVDAIKSATGYQESDKILWNIVFGIAAAIYTVVGIFFDLFASGKIQPWNNLAAHQKEKPAEADNGEEIKMEKISAIT